MANMWKCAAAFLLSLMACCSCPHAFDLEWKDGRSTYYGADDWSIHKGACNYGYIWPNEPLGWDVAAITDFDPDYSNDSCGACYELRCNPAWITDGYGQSLDRTYSCYDPEASMVVRITDVCPCTYAPNEYSNKRWCCNDRPHLDLSVWAWERLADKKWGVIGIQYRRVPCDFEPEKAAPAVTNATPAPPAPLGESPPVRDWPEYTTNRPEPNFAYKQGMGSSWWDGSYNTWVQPAVDSSKAGMREGQGFCAKISPGGAIAFKTNPGAFANRYKLEFWLYVGVTGWEGTAAQVPDININLSGPKGSCESRRIYDVRPQAFEPISQFSPAYFWKWEYYLPYFVTEATTSEVYNSPSSFKEGCGGNAPRQLDTIEFHNDNKWSGDKWVCLDHVALW